MAVCARCGRYIYGYERHYEGTTLCDDKCLDAYKSTHPPKEKESDRDRRAREQREEWEENSWRKNPPG